MIKEFEKRTSVRYFLNKEIEPEKINKLKEIINLSPTSMNCQAFSAIFITDQKIKEKLSIINFNQEHLKRAPLIVIFVADYNRVQTCCNMNNASDDQIHALDHFLVGCVDATIAASTCNAAALELGLGCCFLGGIRQGAPKVKELLNLPKMSFPVIGLTIGYEDKKIPLRPKINKCYDNLYNSETVKNELIEYDKVMEEYYTKYFNKPTTFSAITSHSLGKIHFPELKDLIEEYFIKK